MVFVDGMPVHFYLSVRSNSYFIRPAVTYNFIVDLCIFYGFFSHVVAIQT